MDFMLSMQQVKSGAKCKYDAIYFSMKPQAWHTQASYYISQWDRVTSAQHGLNGSINKVDNTIGLKCWANDRFQTANYNGVTILL